MSFLLQNECFSLEHDATLADGPATNLTSDGTPTAKLNRSWTKVFSVFLSERPEFRQIVKMKPQDSLRVARRKKETRLRQRFVFVPYVFILGIIYNVRCSYRIQEPYFEIFAKIASVWFSNPGLNVYRLFPRKSVLFTRVSRNRIRCTDKWCNFVIYNLARLRYFRRK